MREIRNRLVAASSRYFVISAALALAAALSVLPAQAASAASTSVSVLLPSAGAGSGGGETLSGSQWFDAVPNGSGDTGVQFVLSGRLGNLACTANFGGPCLVGDATLTWIGWLVHFNTENVPNGQYNLIATVSPSGASTNIAVLVSNMAPTVVLPSDGSTVSGNQWLDCVPPPGMSQVQFEVTGAVANQTLTPAVLTWVGWLYDWNTSSVPNGIYDLYCLALTPEGGWASGPRISITVAN
jgi:hypothetical protein